MKRRGWGREKQTASLHSQKRRTALPFNFSFAPFLRPAVQLFPSQTLFLAHRVRRHARTQRARRRTGRRRGSPPQPLSLSSWPRSRPPTRRRCPCRTSSSSSSSTSTGTSGEEWRVSSSLLSPFSLPRKKKKRKREKERERQGRGKGAPRKEGSRSPIPALAAVVDRSHRSRPALTPLSPHLFPLLPAPLPNPT